MINDFVKRFAKIKGDKAPEIKKVLRPLISVNGKQYYHPIKSKYFDLFLYSFQSGFIDDLETQYFISFIHRPTENKITLIRQFPILADIEILKIKIRMGEFFGSFTLKEINDIYIHLKKTTL